MKTSNCLILKNKVVSIDNDTRLNLCYPPRVTEPRQENPSLVVIHWTASERDGVEDADALKKRLIKKKLSVDFFIDNSGIIHQFADPCVTMCRHAGRANQKSIGIEVSNTGWALAGSSLFRKISSKRDSYRATINGWTSTFFDFNEKQYGALFALCDVLSDKFEIEKKVMIDKFERISNKEMNNFNGFLGHLHVDRLQKKYPKCDPGTMPLIKLQKHFKGGLK